MTEKSQKFRKLTAKQFESLSEKDQALYSFELGKHMGDILKKTEKQLTKLFQTYEKSKEIKIAMNIRDHSHD